MKKKKPLIEVSSLEDAILLLMQFRDAENKGIDIFNEKKWRNKKEYTAMMESHRMACEILMVSFSTAKENKK